MCGEVCPSETPPRTPPRARRSSTRASWGRRSVCRRLSVSDRRFLHFCLGDNGTTEDVFLTPSPTRSEFHSAHSARGTPPGPRPVPAGTAFTLFDDSDEEFESEEEADDDEAWRGFHVPRFWMASDDEASGDEVPSDDGQDLQDMFAFDHDRVAEALRRGAGLKELTDLIEEAMADALGNRLQVLEADSDTSARPSMTTPRTSFVAQGLKLGEQLLCTPPPPEVRASPSGGQCTPQMAAELEDRMTPPALDAKLRGVNDSARAFEHQATLPSPARRRCPPSRPSMQAETAATASAQPPRCSEPAAQTVVERAGSLSRSEVVARLRQSMPVASRRQRLSIAKAAEVLEDASGAASDAASPLVEAGADVEEQLRVVQQAIECARRRHRRSIVSAVRRVSQGAAAKEPRIRDQPLPCQKLSRKKVDAIIAAAYRQHPQCPGSNGAPVALLRTRAVPSSAGMPSNTVHCGPAQARSRRAGK
mmetsp:Transcript_17850/g.39135  ORF Transcript_17850/g.39135 Transcript_17850/m.39135 type:complete len:477 (-) Transcript_17850:82-1512(-)